MSANKRRSPRASSLAGASPVAPPTPPVEPEAPADETAEPKPPLKKESEPKPAAKKGTKAPQSRTDTVRQGIYYSTPEEFSAAKSAYLADWQAGGQADTFARWIGQVIETHAARSVDERGRLARPTERVEGSAGFSRSFTLPADTVERMREAINADQAEGRWQSDSAWCGDAIAAAVDKARERAGGNLPQPPQRLPNRLRR